MSVEKTNKRVLFIETDESIFNYKTTAFDDFFNNVERVKGEQKALKLIYNNQYDAIISDMSIDVLDGITFMKQIKEMKPQQIIFTLVATKDEENIGALIDAGIHSFVLEPEQFDQAMETIAGF
jgi:two-component system, OmpR family, response regulator